jgi:hypothetical protein
MTTNEITRGLACRYCEMQMQATLETESADGNIYRLHCENCNPKVVA